MPTTFDAPARAIRCALTVRNDVCSLGARIRPGLHASEVGRRGEDVGGIAVHAAARVAATAGDGEVLVARTVVDQVEGRGIQHVWAQKSTCALPARESVGGCPQDTVDRGTPSAAADEPRIVRQLMASILRFWIGAPRCSAGVNGPPGWIRVGRRRGERSSEVVVTPARICYE